MCGLNVKNNESLKGTQKVQQQTYIRKLLKKDASQVLYK